MAWVAVKYNSRNKCKLVNKSENTKTYNSQIQGGGRLAPTNLSRAARRSIQPSSGQSGRIFTHLNILDLNVQPLHRNVISPILCKS